MSKIEHEFTLAPGQHKEMILVKDNMQCFCPKVPPIPAGQSALGNGFTFTRLACNTCCPFANLHIQGANPLENKPERLLYVISCEGQTIYHEIKVNQPEQPKSNILPLTSK